MKKVLKYVLIFLGGLFLLGLIGAMLHTKNIDNLARASEKESISADTTSAIDVSTEAPKVNWSYDNAIDEMNGQKKLFATTTSINQVDFQFPYEGGSSFELTVRKTGKQNEIYMTVSKGQFMPGDFGDRQLRLKFDEEPPVFVSYQGTSDASANTIFINSVGKVLSKLKTAKKLKVEAEFFDAGKKIINFDIAGLNW